MGQSQPQRSYKKGSYKKKRVYSDQEQNRWENDTVCASRAQTEGKGNDESDESPEPDPQESWQSWPINQLLPAIACKNIS